MLVSRACCQQAPPFHGHFPLESSTMEPPSALPLCRVPRDSRPRASTLPLGNVPLAYLFSNNPRGSGTLPPCPTQPASRISVWAQTPVLKLGHWQVTAEGFPFCWGQLVEMGWAVGRVGGLCFCAQVPLVGQQGQLLRPFSAC